MLLQISIRVKERKLIVNIKAPHKINEGIIYDIFPSSRHATLYDVSSVLAAARSDIVYNLL